jgi:transglutaminase-like putative cysteine protease
MKLQVGYELQYMFPQVTPVIVMLNVHFTRAGHLISPDHINVKPSVPITGYRDSFGNWCSRFVAPAGRVRITTNAVVNDSGQPDRVVPEATQILVNLLPEDALVFLLPSRYCDSDQVLNLAWELFGHAKPGWGRVQAVCDFVHQHIEFGYGHARATRTASQAYSERRGVCRDYAHLAIAFCRALNIPARYCTGYLGDVGVAPPYPPGDFSAWFEAYIGDQWYTFDPRNNIPRIGKVLIARGRDAADVAIATTFGPNTLESFRVWTDELIDA